jgi:hypothetical protein
MLRRIHRTLAVLVCVATLSCSLCAQTGKTITVRMLDARTGKLIAPSNFLVRINHDPTVHGDWVVRNEDGMGKLTVPPGATFFSIRGTYDGTLLLYVNCDCAADKGDPIDRWYATAEILNSGVVAPNDCEKPKAAAKIRPAAKPGEFVFFVRKRNLREKMQDDFSSH